MRSLHVIGSKLPGGAEGFFVRLVQALHEDAQNAGAIVPPRSAVAQALPVAVPRTEIRMRGHWDLLARLQIRRAIAQAAPDVVMTYLGRATRLVRLPAGRRPVHVARLGGYYNPQQYRHAHAWVGNTRGICDYLVGNGFAAGRVFHIPNFVDPPAEVSEHEIAAARHELQLQEGARVILALGRLHTVKGFDVLLRSFAALPDRDRSVLVILGEGAERGSLEAMAHALGVEGSVRMPGWRSALAPYFAIADVLVCPSRAEPFGNVLLDAWSHGVPLISSRTAGAVELIEEGDDGMLVAIDDPVELQLALSAMLDATASARATYVAAGRRKIAERYSRQSVVAAYAGLFEQLTTGL
jgi:glycosyltransferase involved in cell wall biosynthesis